jgi:glycosyltransferase involved in cell wall biosynthesis
MDVIEKIINYINNNKLDEALELIIENDDKLSGEPKFQSIKAVLSIKLGEYNTAINFLETVISACPEDADAYYNIAYAYECLGINSDAAIYYGMAEKYTEDEDLKNELQGIYANDSTLSNIKSIAANLNHKTFIILSSCGWGDVLQRMHHISRSLVKLGQKVFYICPSTNANTTKENIYMDDMIKHSYDNTYNVDGVQIFNPIQVSYNGKNIGNNYTELVQTILNETQQYGETVIVTYMPFQVQTVSKLKGSFKHIYECVDDHSDTEYAFWGNKKDTVWEQELMDISHGITTTAISLYLKHVSLDGRKNIFLSRNAVNEADFICSEKKIPEDLIDIPQPRIVYVGALYEWFDSELFYSVVRSNPDKSFVIIGFGKDEIIKEKLPNLYILGAKKHSELESYLKHTQIGIIPFKDYTDITVNCDPIKHYEYLACGLPVISTFMPECAIDKIYTFQANTTSEFNKAIDTCLKINIDKNEISNFLIENSWNSRAALLYNIANNETSEKLLADSVVPKIECQIQQLVSENPNSIMEAILGIANKNINPKKYYYSLKKAFNKNKSKYITRNYLYSLYEVGDKKELFNIAHSASTIEEHIRLELIYRNELKDAVGIEIMLNYCIANFKVIKKLTREITTATENDLFTAFYLFETGEVQKAANLLGNMANAQISSPFYCFIMNKLFHLNGDLKCAEYLRQYEKILNKYKVKYKGLLEGERNKKNSPETGIITKKKNVKFSIMVPTRNSAEFLKPALMTCLKQDYEGDYEIVVSDNSSPGNYETYEMIKSLDDKKIKYFRPTEELSINENFDFACKNTCGDYVLCMGSDDGLLLHALRYLDIITKQMPNEDIFKWDLVAYGWPEISLDYFEDKVVIPYLHYKNKCNLRYIKSTDVFDAVASYKERYSALPMLYNTALISRRLLNELKVRTGAYYATSPQDVYIGAALLALREKFLYLDCSMAISGTSKRSLGVYLFNSRFHEYSNFQNEGDCGLTDAEKSIEIKNRENSLLKYIVGFAVEENAVVMVLLHIMNINLLDKSWFNKINWMHLFKCWVEQVMISDSDSLFKVKMDDILEKIKIHENFEYEKWFLDNYYNNKEFRGFNEKQYLKMTEGFNQSGGIVLTPSKFGYKDVYGVAKLFQDLFNL